MINRVGCTLALFSFLMICQASAQLSVWPAIAKIYNDPSERLEVLDIHWNLTGRTNKTLLQYSLDNGSSWALITDTITACKGRLFWDLPDVTHRQCSVRIGTVRGLGNYIDTLNSPNTISYYHLSPDATRCLLGGHDDTLRLWDVQNKVLLSKVYKSRDSRVSHGFIGDKELLFATDDQYSLGDYSNIKNAYLYSGRTGKLLLRFTDVQNFGLRMNREGTRCLVIRKYPLAAQLWDVPAKKLIDSFPDVSELDGSEDDLHFSGWISTQASHGPVIPVTAIWRYDDGALVKQIPDADPSTTMSCQTLTLTGATEDSASLHVIDRLNKVRTGLLHTENDKVNFYNFNSQYSRVAICLNDTVDLWDVHSFKRIARLKGSAYDECHQMFSPFGDRVMLRLTYGDFMLYDANDGRLISRLKCGWNEHQVETNCDDCMANEYDKVQFAGKGSRVLITPSCNGSGGLHPVLWNTQTGRIVKRFRLPYRDFIVCTDGKRLIGILDQSVSDKKTGVRRYGQRLDLLDANSGKTISTQNVNPFYGNLTSPEKHDSVMFVVLDGVAMQWNLYSGRVVHRFAHNQRPVKEYESNAERLITLDTFGGLQLWNTLSGRMLQSLSESGVIQFVVSHNGLFTAALRKDSASDESVWHFWSNQSGQELPHLSFVANKLLLDRCEFSADDKVFIIKNSSQQAVFCYMPGNADTVFTDSAGFNLDVPVLPNSVVNSTASIDTSLAIDTIAAKHYFRAKPDPVLSLNHSPEPANGMIEVGYRTPSNGFAQLSLCDLQGRLVQSLFQGQVSAGAHTSMYRVNALPSGVYLLVLNVAGQSVSQKLTLAQ